MRWRLCAHWLRPVKKTHLPSSSRVSAHQPLKAEFLPQAFEIPMHAGIRKRPATEPEGDGAVLASNDPAALACDGRYQTASRTILRRSGTVMASNHGFFRIHTVLRQLGCGSGKYRGVQSPKALTVSVIERFRVEAR